MMHQISFIAEEIKHTKTQSMFGLLSLHEMGAAFVESSIVGNTKRCLAYENTRSGAITCKIKHVESGNPAC